MTTDGHGSGQVVAVTGATGFVGRHLVRAMLDRGWSVRALARDIQKASKVLPKSDRLEIVQGGIFDEAAVATLLKGATACAHLIGIIRESGGGSTFERMHVEATQAILSGCKAAGVGRYLHMSALGAHPDGPSDYQRTKFKAESSVRTSGLDWTIFRPSMIHGPDGEFTLQMKSWVEGRSAPWLFLPYFLRIEQEGTPSPVNPPHLVAPKIAPIYIEDVTSAFIASLETREAIGEVYELCGSEVLSWPEMLRTARGTWPLARRELHPIGIPGKVAALKAKAAKIVGLGDLMPFDAGMALMGEQDNFCDYTKASRQIGFTPKPFSESMKSYAKA